MNYQYLSVNPGLTEYLRSVLVIDHSPHSIQPRLPLFTSGMPALLYQQKNKSHQLTLYGESLPNEKWTGQDNTISIVFLFKPFSLSPVFNLPAKELKENPFELEKWNAQKTMALKIQLDAISTATQKLGVLEHFILSQAQVHQHECRIIHYATDQLMQNSDTNALEQILDQLNLTERTFQRIFKKYVGITPNEYRRICQFYFSFSQLKGRHFEKLTDVAYHNHYFDQSHYIRAFREFTGITPHQYLQEGLKKDR